MKNKELPRPHKDYLDHLVRDMINPETSSQNKEGAEDMYLITAKRTGQTVNVDGFRCTWYSTFGDCIKVS